MKTWIRRILGLAATVVVSMSMLAPPASAVPTVLTYVGYLTHTNGVPYSGSISATLTLWTTEVAGDGPIYAESYGPTDVI